MKNSDHKTFSCRRWLESATMAALGGGLLTSSPAAIRDLPKVAGEYYQIDMPAAYGLYAHNVHGLIMHNIRFELQTLAAQPAVIFDKISDASISGLSAQGSARAELLRFTKVHDTLLPALQLLTPAATFLNVEGNRKEGITIYGGEMRQPQYILKMPAKINQ